MQICESLGEQAGKAGNPPVGSVIISPDEKIIGKGMEAGKTHQDITYHAEIEAIRDAVRNLGIKNLEGSTMYTTHEPCIMCSYVIRHHRISRVVIKNKVKSIGGVSSSYPILSASDIDIWSSPPEIIFLD